MRGARTAQEAVVDQAAWQLKMRSGDAEAPAERLILSFRGDVMGGALRKSVEDLRGGQRYSDDDASCSAEGGA